MSAVGTCPDVPDLFGLDMVGIHSALCGERRSRHCFECTSRSGPRAYRVVLPNTPGRMYKWTIAS